MPVVEVLTQLFNSLDAFGLMATPLAQASNSSNTGCFTRLPTSTKSDVLGLSASSLQSTSCVLLEQLAKDAQIIPDIGETLTACMSFLFSRLRRA
jgi:hypothetical protein